jgi:hypothetical protein
MVNPLKTTPFRSAEQSAEVIRCVTRSWTAPMTAAGARWLGDIGDLKMAILTFWEYMRYPYGYLNIRWLDDILGIYGIVSGI